MLIHRDLGHLTNVLHIQMHIVNPRWRHGLVAASQKHQHLSEMHAAFKSHNVQRTCPHACSNHIWLHRLLHCPHQQTLQACTLYQCNPDSLVCATRGSLQQLPVCSGHVRKQREDMSKRGMDVECGRNLMKSTGSQAVAAGKECCSISFN